MREYIKSPLNYTGGKYKLLPQILPLFPKHIDTFVDLFCGGCNVVVNIESNKKICNDIEHHVIDLFQYFKNVSGREVVNQIENIIEKYGLSNSDKNGYEYYGCDSSKGLGEYNKEKYNSLRKEYNKNTDNPIMFFATVIFAFCNQIRYNSKGEFNMPVNKRDFNKNVRKNTFDFVDNIDSTFFFTSKDFRELKTDKLGENDFVYCDPPYLITTASYNENGGWTERDDEDLMRLLDTLNEKNIKFAMSNVFYHKGKINENLIKWSEKYKVHHLNHSYSNCNYHDLTGTSGKSDEVLITNY